MNKIEFDIPVKLIGEDNYRVDLIPRSKKQFFDSILKGVAENPDKPFLLDVHKFEEVEVSRAIDQLCTRKHGISFHYNQHAVLTKHELGFSRYTFYKGLKLPSQYKDRRKFYYTDEEMQQAHEEALNCVNILHDGLVKTTAENEIMQQTISDRQGIAAAAAIAAVATMGKKPKSQAQIDGCIEGGKNKAMLTNDQKLDICLRAEKLTYDTVSEKCRFLIKYCANPRKYLYDGQRDIPKPITRKDGKPLSEKYIRDIIAPQKT